MKETIPLLNFLEDMKIAVPSKLSNRFILDLFNDDENFSSTADLPYDFIEEVSQRGDGSGYETFWVFERKSDGKYFFYYSYDGRIEGYELEETEKITNPQWGFECQY